MGLFTSKEEKEQKQQQKDREKAEADLMKARAKLSKHHLEDIDDEYVESCLDILGNLRGSGMMELGKTLSGMKTEEELKITYLHAIMDQNWIIIRQLDKIAKLLQH